MKPLAPFLLVTGLFAGDYAQMDLSALSTQTVKAGQPWASIQTRIESQDLDLKIQQGVVTTMATLGHPAPAHGRQGGPAQAGPPIHRFRDLAHLGPLPG